MKHSSLTVLINRGRNSHFVRSVDSFLRNPLYVLMIAVLAALSGVFGLELPVYTLYICVGIFICLFGRDLLALMPIVICCYIAPSFSNNPGRNPNSIFYLDNGGVYLIIIAALFFICLVFRLITDAQCGGLTFLRKKRRLISGMIVLSAAYLLSGIGIQKYGEFASRNLLFALIQAASIIVMYYLFSGAVKWEDVPKDYFAWIGLGVGFAVLAQLGENYLSGRAFLEGGKVIDRELMATGWGMHNNIGCMMATMIPFVFYLASKRKYSWIYTLLATVLLLGTLVSCSRTSMIIASVEYVVCAVLLLRDRSKRVANLIVFLGAGFALGLFAIISFDKLMHVFALFLQEIDTVSKRDVLFINGLKQFREYPVFGGTFFPQGDFVPWDWAELEAFSSFFPPRWHNTLVQIAASCGVVGLAAYSFHRLQTIILFAKNRSSEKLYIALYVTALLVASLLDCHFFNVGPVLMYSMALAFAENIGESKI